MNLHEFKEKMKDSSQFHIQNKSNQLPVDQFLMPNEYRKPNYFRNIALSAMSFMVVLLFSFYIYLNLTPISTLTIDINPSIEVELNRFDRVVNIKANNQEGLDFISELNVKNKPLDTLLNQVYQKGIENGYFNESNAYALIGVYGENYEIENRINQVVSNNESIQVLAINQHSENNELRFSSSISLIIETTYGSIDENFGETPGDQNSDDYPATGDIILEEITSEELLNIIEEYALSQTHLEVIIQIFNDNANYTTDEDFMYLVNLSISDLIDLYNQTN